METYSHFIDDWQSSIGKIFDFVPSIFKDMQLKEIILDHKVLQSLIEFILTDDAKILEVTKNSFVHPNAAIKIPLLSAGKDGPEVRIHYWFPSNIAEESSGFLDIHNHKWNLVSRVISGTLTQKIYHPHDNGDIYNKYVLTSRGNWGESDVKYDKTKALSVNEFSHMSPGTVYGIHNSILHSVSSLHGYTITVMCRGRYQKDKTTIFRRKMQFPQKLSTIPLDIHDVVRILRSMQ